jgi:hypothetical protein
MKHPIYKDQGMNKVRAMFIELISNYGYNGAKDIMAKRFAQANGLDVGLVMSQADGQLRAFIIEDTVAKEGHVLIDVDREEWDSENSRKTLAKMDISLFKFPFTSGTLSMGGRNISYAVPKEKEDGKSIHLCYSSETGTHMVYINGGQSLEKSMDEYRIDDANKNVVYDVMSVLLFVATFNGTKQIKKIVTPVTSGSKRKSIPKHVINKILLKPSVSGSDYSNLGGTKKSKSDKTWIVRGYWRNQYYAKTKENKPKWIAPHWRGAGKEQVEKVYKV